MTERKIWDEILTARDEARVKLHLAGMDAKDAFNKLDTRINAFANKAGLKLENLGEDLAEETKTTLAELRAEIDDVRKKLNEKLKKS